MVKYKAKVATVKGERQAKRIAKLFSNAEKEVAAKLTALYAQGKSETATAKQLKKQRDQINDILDELGEKANSLTDVFVETVYKGGTEEAKKDLKKAGVEVSDFGNVNRKVIETYSEQIRSRLADVITTAGRTTQDIYKSASLNTALSGVLSGYESITATEKKILNKLEQTEGITGFIDNAGHNWNMSSYVDMLTRTTTMQIYNEAKKVEYMAHGEDLVQVSRHTPCCAMCAPYNGVILSLSGNSDKYESVSDAEAQGLFHPNCRHTYTLFLEGIDEKDDNLHEPDWSEIFGEPDKLTIAEEKIRNYSLNKQAGEVAYNKAVAFEKALGYTQNSYKELLNAIRENVNKFEYKTKEVNQYGFRCQNILNLTGPNGKSANVLTSWIVGFGSDKARMVSAYITKKKVEKKNEA